jgi:hypothetical protein
MYNTNINTTLYVPIVNTDTIKYGTTLKSPTMFRYKAHMRKRNAIILAIT